MERTTRNSQKQAGPDLSIGNIQIYSAAIISCIQAEFRIQSPLATGITYENKKWDEK